MADSDTLSGIESPGILGSYFPKPHPARPHPGIKDAFKSSLTILNPSGIETLGLPHKTSHVTEFRDHTDLIKICPVKRHYPTDKLSTGLIPSDMPKSPSPAKAQNQQRQKDTSFHDIGERPQQPKDQGIKCYDNLAFTLSDKHKDPYKFEYKYHGDHTPPNLSQARVSQALKMIYEHYPESTKSLPTVNKHVSERAEKDPVTLYDNVLSNVDGAGSGNYSRWFQEPKSGKRRSYTPPPSTVKELLSTPEASAREYISQTPRPSQTPQNKSGKFIPDLRPTKKNDKTPEKFEKQMERDEVNNQWFTKDLKRVGTALSNFTIDLDSPREVEAKNVVQKVPIKRQEFNKVIEEIGDSAYNSTSRKTGRTDNATTRISTTPRVSYINDLGAKTPQSKASPVKPPLTKSKTIVLRQGFLSKMNSNYDVTAKLSISSISLVQSEKRSTQLSTKGSKMI